MKNISPLLSRYLSIRWPLALALSALLVGSLTAKAQTLVFYENFEVNHNLDGTWVTNYTANGTNVADLYFDYSTIGVPLSPHSTNSSTHAIRLAANVVTGSVFPIGVSVSPVGFGITENFDMHYDGWWNFNGPFPAGGSSSTMIGGAGYGTAGTNAQVAGTADSVFIGASTDGNTGSDFRVYSSGHQISYQGGSYRIGSSGTDTTILGDPGSGYVYAGDNGSRDSDVNSPNGYYWTNFPAAQCPTNEFLLFPQQTNSDGTFPGAPGFPKSGTVCFKWHDVSLQKIANTMTYKIDGILIATIDVVDAGALGGTNILFNMYDINNNGSTDPNRTNLIYTLVDNVRITNFPNVVTVTSVPPSTVAEASPGSPGTFVVTRTSSGQPLTVTYTMLGSAQNGVDYTNATGGPLSGSVTFSQNATATNIYVYPVDDTIPEVTETIIMSIDSNPNYVGAGTATIRIVDNETPQLTLTNVDTQVFERTNDFASVVITRLGDTNRPSFSVNLAFSGTATLGTDYYTNAVVTFDPGVVSTNFTIYPIEDNTYEGNETITISVAPAGAGEYTIGSQGSASITLVDANNPPETVLFQDNLHTDTSANWTKLWAANDGIEDDTVTFGYDYSGLNIAAAPHSAGDTHGLLVAVNKEPNDAAAAAVNLYPNGQNFSGNFALRFDMFLDIPRGSGSSTEYALLGLNHSGTKTNWWRSGGVPAGWDFDGVFYAIETDAQAVPNYANYSSPNVNDNPTNLVGVSATNFPNVFKTPPWSASGEPAVTATNSPYNAVWSEVELSQVSGTQTLRINNSTIMSYANTTPYTSGNIMIGYEDAFDSIGPIECYAIFANLRVISLRAPLITSIHVTGGNAVIEFNANATDQTGQFTLQSAASVAGPYADVSSTLISLGGGNFRATKAAPVGVQFYRIRRLY